MTLWVGNATSMLADVRGTAHGYFIPRLFSIVIPPPIPPLAFQERCFSMERLIKTFP